MQEPSGTNPGTKQNMFFLQVFERFCGIGACRNQVEPTLEPSKSLDLSTFHCWTPSRNQVEPSQEPSNSAVNNIPGASWNQVEPSGTKPGAKPKYCKYYTCRILGPSGTKWNQARNQVKLQPLLYEITVLAPTPSPYYNTK